MDWAMFKSIWKEKYRGEFCEFASEKAKVYNIKSGV